MSVPEYHLVIHHASYPGTPIHTIHSETPFLSIGVGDTISAQTWNNQPTNKDGRVTRVEHLIFTAQQGNLYHQIHVHVTD